MDCKPKLRFPEFSGEWEQKSVEDLIDEQILEKPLDGNHGNLHPKSSDFVSEGIPFIMACDLKNGKVNTSNCSFIGKKQADNLQKGFSREGDVLLSHKATIGQTAVVKEINTDYIMLTPQVTYYRVKNLKKLYNYFLKHYFDSPGFQHIFKLWAIGSTRSYLGISKQQKLPISMPNLAEQEKIASFLSKVDGKIEKLEKKQELWETYKKGIMQQIFSQKLRFKDENGEDYPDWEEKPLNGVSILNPKSINLPKKFIYIDLESVESGILKKRTLITKDEAPSRAQRVLKGNDILYQTVRPYQRNNFFFNSINSGFYVASTGYAQIRSKEDPEFIYHVLHTDDFVNKVLARCTGTSYPAINSKDLGKIKIRIPSLLEQKKISKFISAIDSKIECLEKELEINSEYKKGLLQQMFC